MKTAPDRKIYVTVIIFYCLLFLPSLFKTQTSNISGTINIYTPVTAIDTTGCKTKVTVGSVAGFATGDSVLIIQMKGANFDSTNTSSFGNVINLRGAGNYEIAAISSISGNIIELNGDIVNTYMISGFVQLVRIPTYVNANITSMLTCQAWNGQTGGVLIFSVQNNLQFNASINVTGRGFRGGNISMNPDGSCGSGSPGYYYPLNPGGSFWSVGGAQKGEGIGTIAATKQAGRGPLVNGGGGGNKHNTGGGGGSNYTQGGKGGNELSGCTIAGTGGVGGISLSSYYLNNRLFAGGGGGCGDYNNYVGSDGEKGGGIVIITASSITGNNYLLAASGNTVTVVAGAAADGAGGGGGGGTIFIKAGSSSGLNLAANGGNGGNQNPAGYCAGPGGGGGTGAILTSLSSLSGNTYLLNAGIAGTFQTASSCGANYGAQPGTANTTGPLTSKNLVYTPSAITPTISANNFSVCTGQSIYLTNTSTSGTFISWTGPLSYYSTQQNPTITPASAANSGNYTLTVVSASGCSVSAISSVTVDNGPTVSINNASLCTGQTINLNPVAPANSSFAWTGPNSFSSSAPAVSIPNANPSMAGAYNLTATASNGCSNTAVAYVSVTTVTVPTVSVNSPICEGGSLALTASGGSGGLSYTWSGQGYSSPSQNAVISPVTQASSGSYTLAAALNGCTVYTVTPPVVINPAPLISVSNATFCFGRDVSLMASSPTATLFNWQGPNGFSTSSPSFSFANASSTLSGIYNLTVTSASGCTNTASTTLSVLTLPTTILSANAPICIGGNLTLNANGGTDYIYSGPNGFTSSQQNVTIQNISSAASGIYTVVASYGGYCPISASISVVVLSGTTGTLTSALNKKCAPFCPGLFINTSDTILITNITVNGQYKPGPLSNYCLNAAGNYNVIVSFKNTNGCVNTSSLVLNAYPKPSADFDFSPLKPLEAQDEVLFTNTSTGEQLTNWKWYFVNNNGYTSQDKNTSYLFENGGSYPVAMVVKNAWGCEDTIIKLITVDEDFCIFIPDAFTPNGDQLNDIFQPKGHGILNYSIEIYDRWGERLFTSSDFFKGWDGSYKGSACKSDIYEWKITLTNSSHKKKEMLGHVTLYR